MRSGECTAPTASPARPVSMGNGNSGRTTGAAFAVSNIRREGAIGGRSFPPEQIGAAIQMYYTGLSFRQAAKELKHRFGIHETDVSPETIRNWVDSYTDAAIRLVRDLKVPGDGLWWVFTIHTTNNKPLWRLVLDDTTGYIFGDEFGRIKGG